MKKAYIISTGTELLLGMTVDTNASYISQELASIGIMVVGMSIVGDNKENMQNAFLLAVQSADIIIASGGLGPTKDDLTKEVACEVMGVNLVLNEDEVNRLKDYFTRRNKNMPKSNLKQAMFPNKAIILDNPLGTAPGMYLKEGEKVIILLPGPPKEMKKMLVEKAKPLLIKEFNLTKDLSVKKTIKVFGPGESQVEDMIAPIMENPKGCSIALIAEEGEILIKVTAEGRDEENSIEILDSLVGEIEEKLGRHVFGYDDDKLKQIVAAKLKENNQTIAVAESCTGGLISKLLTDISGSSEYFWGSVISYSNEAKQNLLGVSEQTLAEYGAVSKETAIEMAKGVKKLANSCLGLAITGIAGPEGGSNEKPVGLVYISLATDNDLIVKELKFVGDRVGIRTLAAKSALDIVRRFLEFGGL